MTVKQAARHRSVQIKLLINKLSLIIKNLFVNLTIVVLELVLKSGNALKADVAFCF